MTKRKSISHCWHILIEHYGLLWKQNLWYLLCVMPSMICGFLFVLFHAYLFLVFAVAGLILACPGILAIHRIVLETATNASMLNPPTFWGLYRSNGKKGFRLGLFLALGILLIAMPTYFSLMTQSNLFPLLLCFSGMWLLLWFCSSSQLLSCLCADEKRTCSQVLQSVFAPGAVGIALGLVKLAWGVLCIFVPTLAIALALLGIPTVLRFSILYALYSRGDEAEESNDSTQSAP